MATINVHRVKTSDVRLKRIGQIYCMEYQFHDMIIEERTLKPPIKPNLDICFARKRVICHI